MKGYKRFCFDGSWIAHTALYACKSHLGNKTLSSFFFFFCLVCLWKCIYFTAKFWNCINSNIEVNKLFGGDIDLFFPVKFSLNSVCFLSSALLLSSVCFIKCWKYLLKNCWGLFRNRIIYSKVFHNSIHFSICFLSFVFQQ